MAKITRFAVQTLVATLVVVVVAIYCDVRSQAGSVYHKIADVPEAPVAIVFGAGIGTPVLKDRVRTAVSLYRCGKVHKILMTGDNSHLNYDEPEAMKSLAVADGIPAADIACDYAGFRTYDSLYRAFHIFDVRKAILITQAFHLPRAMYIAKHLGLSSVGVDASLHSYGLDQYWYELREIFASECAWLDVFTQRKPRFLGKKESLYVTDVPG